MRSSAPAGGVEPPGTGFGDRSAPVARRHFIVWGMPNRKPPESVSRWAAPWHDIVHVMVGSPSCGAAPSPAVRLCHCGGSMTGRRYRSRRRHGGGRCDRSTCLSQLPPSLPTLYDAGKPRGRQSLFAGNFGEVGGACQRQGSRSTECEMGIVTQLREPHRPISMWQLRRAVGQSRHAPD